MSIPRGYYYLSHAQGRLGLDKFDFRFFPAGPGEASYCTSNLRPPASESGFVPPLALEVASGHVECHGTVLASREIMSISLTLQ